MIYLCVDAGQTKTQAALLDERDSTVETWTEAPVIHPSRLQGMDRLRHVVDRVLERAHAEIQGHAHGDVGAACFSISGYHGREPHISKAIESRIQTIFPSIGKITTIPDYVGNWFAATQGEPGIVIISGGGSVAYARDRTGASLRVGGWGHVLGDEGSGYWIGLRAAKAALRSWSGLEPAPAMERLVSEAFRLEDEAELMRKAYSGEISGEDFARLVPGVDALAREGDRSAGEIIDEAAAYLLEMILAVERRLGTLPVYLSGGVFRAPGMRERFQKAMLRSGYAGDVSLAPSDPMQGILLAARKRGG